MSQPEIPTCQVCHQNPGVGVASVPGIPISLSWCKICLEAQCYGPYEIHWTNLSLIACPDADLDSDYEILHWEIMESFERGEIIQALKHIIVWRGGYKTMWEALNDGPPKEDEA